MRRVSKTALAKAKPSLYFLKNRCSWNGPRPGAAMQLLVTDPTATHALRKSRLDCNTLVLSACGIEDDLFHRAPCSTPTSRQSSPGQRVLSSNPSVRWPVPAYALHAPTNLYLLSPRINTYRTYMHTRPTYIHSCIHIYMYRHKYTHRYASTNEYLCI